MRVFISYSHANKRRAERLAQALLDTGIDVWFDDWSVLVGHKLEEQVYEGILQSDLLLILLTQSSISSAWVREELSFARIREIESKQTSIVPLLYEDCEIPPELRTKVFADFRRNFDDGFKSLSRLLTAKTTGRDSAHRKGVAIETDITVPLTVHYAISVVLSSGLGMAAETGQKRRDAVASIERVNDLVRQMGQTRGLDVRAYKWIQDIIDLSSNSASPRNIASEVFQRWQIGKSILPNALSHKLSGVPLVAFELGRGWRVRMPGDSDKHAEEYWCEQCMSMFKELALPEKFIEFSKTTPDSQRVRRALEVELSRVTDYALVRQFNERRTVGYGLLAGAKSVRCLDKLAYGLREMETRAETLVTLSDIAEYAISEFGFIEEGEKLLRMAMEITDDISEESLKHDFEAYASLVALLRDAAFAENPRSNGKSAFLLGLLLLLLVEDVINGEEVSGKNLRNIESIAAGLSLRAADSEELHRIIDGLLYGHGEPKEEITSWIVKQVLLHLDWPDAKPSNLPPVIYARLIRM